MLGEIKIECVKPVEGLTIGQSYNVLNDEFIFYTVINDNGMEQAYYQSDFKVISKSSEREIFMGMLEHKW